MNLEKPAEEFSLNKFWLSNRQHREQPEVMLYKWNVCWRTVIMRIRWVPKEFQYYPGQLAIGEDRGAIMMFHCKLCLMPPQPHRHALGYSPIRINFIFSITALLAHRGRGLFTWSWWQLASRRFPVQFNELKSINYETNSKKKP